MATGLHDGLTCSEFTDDNEIGFAFEHAAHAGTHQIMIVGKIDSNHRPRNEFSLSGAES